MMTTIFIPYIVESTLRIQCCYDTRCVCRVKYNLNLYWNKHLESFLSTEKNGSSKILFKSDFQLYIISIFIIQNLRKCFKFVVVIGNVRVVRNIVISFFLIYRHVLSICINFSYKIYGMPNVAIFDLLNLYCINYHLYCIFFYMYLYSITFIWFL